MITRRTQKRMLAMAIDAGIVVAAYLLSVVFRFAAETPAAREWLREHFLIFVAIAIVVHLTANWVASVYTIVNRYIGLKQATHLLEATAGATVLLVLVSWLWPSAIHLLPLSSVASGGLIAFCAMAGFRFYSRIFQERSLRNVNAERRLLVIGAGGAASMIIRETRRNRVVDTHIVGLVDDNPELLGMRLDDVPVLGGVEDVVELARKHDITEILVAIPSATPEQMGRINRLARPAQVPVKTLPSLAEVMEGASISITAAREIDILDLLGRPAVEIDLGAIAAYLQNKTVLVTGAGGSIGSELCRQISTFRPAMLVLVDHDESALYALHEEFRSKGFTNYEVQVTSILQTRKMDKLFATYRPHAVFHAAAYKHVPLMERHPDEAVLNNVKGTLIVAETAARHRAECMVNISTDKAIDPSSVMGATKRVGELLLADVAARHTGTRFCSVRFGNVLGSRGSVIPIFQRQIELGGPLTITHPDMKRYFMTIQEAVKLVLQAASFLQDDEAVVRYGPHRVFVLEMGEPISIVDLAQQMLQQYAGNGNGDGNGGGEARRDISVEFIGLRPGEKLEEQLFYATETSSPTPHPMIWRATHDDRVAAAAPGSREPAAVPAGGRALTAPVAVAGDEAAGPTSLQPPAGGSTADADPADGFRELLKKTIALAEKHSGPEDIVPMLQILVPTYTPFDKRLVGSFSEHRPAPRRPADVSTGHTPSPRAASPTRPAA